MTRIKVMLADDNEIFREGLARLLEDHGEIEVVSLCSSGREVIEQVKQTEPDVVLIDSEIPEPDSISVTTELGKSLPEVKVALFTGSGNKEHIYAAIEAGAKGYLSHQMKVGDLVKSIDLIEKGQVVVSPQLAAQLASKLSSLKMDERAGKDPLSEREIEVLKLLTKGHTNKEIADKLYITENTARVHLKNILEKLRLRNRQQAAAYAVKQGFVSEIEGT